MAQDECHLLRLSTELILQILEYGPTSTYLDVALTCTTLHHQCRNLLDLHREAHAKYRITSDLSPETVIDLLKDTTKARIERWHVRELEIWGSRQDWEDWRPWVPKLPGTCGLADGFPTRYGLDLQDMQRYIRTALELWIFSDFDSEAIQWDLKAGQDGFLKLLLIATCPRLHSLRFVKRGLDPHTTLQWMREVIKDSRRTEDGPHELQGFESLRDLAVDGNEDYQHFDVVDQYDFPRGTSSVKHLSIDSASEFSPEYYQGRADVSKKLESVVLRVASEQRQDLDDVDVFVGSLSFSNGKTLQKLIIYNPGGMHGYQCRNYRLDDLDDFGNLKLFTLAVSDIELEELHLMHSSPNAEQLILQESVAAGLKTGVHVCTLMNRDDGGYWKNFPGKPDRFELKTGPCYGERPASWRLNLQSGEWGPDCEGCGECKDCLVVYPAELWKSSRP
ncbi:hypothetical protein FOC1_g10010916 [Fusarium oxysporum f. sp. cubense race 1]|uniref:Uncharacterized protein n=1 Tax=Fusarium oxysporum f. sp. cubense (strain race 1) TaxID=1229664 RepID=N4TVH6_FUSC1|nr:hypothetical protein FOC1_g10010916 [Fusarium oxysporum f. sp. cubense race 1]